MESLQGKVAVVTGASSGIGAAIVKEFISHGLQVVGIARRLVRLEILSKELSDKPGKLYPFKADVSKEDEILEAFKWTLEKLGRVDILVNCAGIVQDDRSLMNGITENWRKVIDVNLLALCIANREAIQIMNQKKIDGHIVNINGICGHYHTMLSAIYGTTKFGVTQITEALRRELIEAKSKIRVTSISPGIVDTEILKNFDANEILNSMPKLNPEDIAASVWHAVSAPPHVQIHEMIIRPVGEIF